MTATPSVPAGTSPAPPPTILRASARSTVLGSGCSTPMLSASRPAPGAGAGSSATSARAAGAGPPWLPGRQGHHHRPVHRHPQRQAIVEPGQLHLVRRAPHGAREERAAQTRSPVSARDHGRPADPGSSTIPTSASTGASVLANAAGATEDRSSNHTRLAEPSSPAASAVPDPTMRTAPPAAATVSAAPAGSWPVPDHDDGQARGRCWHGHSSTATRCPSITAACARRGVTQSPIRCTSNGDRAQLAATGIVGCLVDRAHNPVAAPLCGLARGVVEQGQLQPAGSAAGSGSCAAAPTTTKSVAWRIPLACARTLKVSISSVMPRSWPTTIPAGDDLHRAAPVGQQLGHAGRLVETEIIDHDHLPGRLGPALDHVADVHHAGMTGRPVRRLSAGPRWPESRHRATRRSATRPWRSRRCGSPRRAAGIPRPGCALHRGTRRGMVRRRLRLPGRQCAAGVPAA